MKMHNNKSKLNRAFSMAEMLVVMLILSIVIISMTPMVVKRVRKESVNPEHGAFECYYDKDDDGNDVIIERWRNAEGENISGDIIHNPAEQNYCEYVPRRGAMFFTVNAIGGGSPGMGIPSNFTALPNQGIDYTNMFYTFKSLLINTDNQNINNFDFTGLTYDDEEMEETPVKWLKRDGINILSLMQSDGGTLTPARGAAYLIETRLDNSSYCAATPDYRSLSWSEEDQCFYSYDKYNLNRKCVRVNIFLGKNPESGSALSMVKTLRQGSSLYSSSIGASSPSFAINDSGCRVSMGDDGCFGGYADCNPMAGQSSNYSDGIACAPHSITIGGGYGKRAQTLINHDDQGQNVSYSNTCYYDSSTNTWNGSHCPPVWINNAVPSSYTKWFLHTMGNFVLADKKNSKGINFYAQAGNPGEFRTMYVSHFKGAIQIIPGAPAAPSATENTVPGNPTVICYVGRNHSCAEEDGGAPLLTVPGGRRTQTAEGASTFIVGNIFNLSKNPKVIAYDNATGDTSGRMDEYGDYFIPRDSVFVYPVATGDSPIPLDVGAGGHGGYTIYRKTGVEDVYEMYKAKVTESGTQKYSIDSSVIQDVDDDYECKGRRFTTSGHGSTSHYCYSGDGRGGAVVITW